MQFSCLLANAEPRQLRRLDCHLLKTLRTPNKVDNCCEILVLCWLKQYLLSLLRFVFHAVLTSVTKQALSFWLKI